jgi:aspartate/methionine/tyrosine aminotransferase
MHWAKTLQSARYTLAVSGIKPLQLSELGASLDDLQLTAGPGYGLPELMAAVASKAGVAADRIVLATGTSGANHLALATLLAPGDDALIESPGYDPIEMLARHLGAKVRFFRRRPENGFRIDPAEVAAGMTKNTRLVVLSNLHNPSSVATGGETLRELGAIAERWGARVLVDEAYLDAAFAGGPPSGASLGDGFVVTTSLTKVFGLGGLRCGWIVAEPGLATRIWLLKNLFGVDEVHPAGGLALCALRQSSRLLERARGLLETNRAAWGSFLAERDDLAVPGVSAGTTVFAQVLSCDAEALCAHLRERYETSIVPGRFFGAPEFVRLGLCGDTVVFREGLARVGRALDDLAGGGGPAR